MGMFFAAYLIYFTFSMNGIFDRMLYDYYETTEHEYIGYCELGEDCVIPTGGEAVIELPAVVLDGEAASLLAIDSASTIHPLINPKGENITSDLADGIILSRALALSRRYNVGDELELIVGQDSVTVEVVGISDEYTGNKIYASRSWIGNLLLEDDTFYNAVYARSELDDADYQVVIHVDDIITQADAMTSFMQAFVLIMVVISIALGAMIIYLLTSMTIEDNFYNISLFKVMGFETKEINRIILGGYLIYGIAIFLLCIPMAIGSFYLMEWFFAWYYDLLFPIDFVWWHAPVALGIFLVLFELGAFHAKHRLERIALQEAMKRYQV
jgi:putative ABC transport system permease protein